MGKEAGFRVGSTFVRQVALFCSLEALSTDGRDDYGRAQVSSPRTERSWPLLFSRSSEKKQPIIFVYVKLCRLLGCAPVSFVPGEEGDLLRFHHLGGGVLPGDIAQLCMDPSHSS